MKCSYCGAEMKEHTLFCENCGKEVQIVPDYNVYDDDYLNNVLVHPEEASEDEESNAVLSDERLKKEEKLRKLKKQKELEKLKKQKQKRIIMIVASVALLALVILIVFFVFKITNDNKNSKSYGYQIEQGRKAQKDNRIDDAISYFEKAASIDKTDVSVRQTLAELYFLKKDYNSIIVVCSEILAIDKEDSFAYEYLLKAYDAQKDYDKIKELSLKAPSNKEIISLFDDYIVVAPVSNYESGEYEDFIDVELTGSADSIIYYTLNGDDPKGSTAIEYNEAISLKETGKYRIKAIAKNSKDIYSEVVTFNIEIDLAAPVAPNFSLTNDGLDEKKEPIVGAFYIEKKTKDDKDNTDNSEETESKEEGPAIIKINVPENCEAYYEWNKETPSVSSNKYDPEKGIEIIDGKNEFYIIFIDTRNDKCSVIKSHVFEYYGQ